jgi:hypothetical protein
MLRRGGGNAPPPLADQKFCPSLNPAIVDRLIGRQDARAPLRITSQRAFVSME